MARMKPRDLFYRGSSAEVRIEKYTFRKVPRIVATVQLHRDGKRVAHNKI